MKAGIRTIIAGLIGCGSIGSVIARAIDDGEAGDVELEIVYDIVREHAEKLVSSLSKKPRIARNADELLKDEKIQLVIEAASQEAVRQYAVKALSEGKDFMVMSTGALLDEELFREVSNAAKRSGGKVYVPSGAIVGLDNVKAAAVRHIDEILLITRKPPRSFEGAPLVKKRGIDLSRLDKPVILFEGSAREAVKLFPRNVNVSASLSLAGVGPDRTRVRIIADPKAENILHEIHVRGEFGEILTRTINKPFPENPKTSYIAALSAIATLRKISGSIVVGT